MIATSSITTLRGDFFQHTETLNCILDAELNFIDVNEAFLKTLRFKKEQVIGKNLKEISPDCVSSGRCEKYLEVLHTGKALLFDEVRPHPSLGNIYLRVRAFKIGDHLGISAKNTSDFKEAIDELETFIYKASHDMRSPIASILGLINISDHEIKDVADSKQFFKLVKQQVARLDNILVSLIETTQIQKTEKTPELIDFNQIISDVLNSLEYKEGFDQVKIQYDVNLNNDFHSDKAMIISIFQNLTDNAIKYSKINNPNAFLNISVTPENSGVKIVFEDNGIGISESLQKNIFKMFFRATKQAAGTGLGLYTVKHCVKKLGGHISVQSKENSGTSFRIYLPNDYHNNKHIL
jgi:signal transduction histidine kinase